MDGCDRREEEEAKTLFHTHPNPSSSSLMDCEINVSDDDNKQDPKVARIFLWVTRGLGHNTAFFPALRRVIISKNLRGQ